MRASAPDARRAAAATVARRASPLSRVRFIVARETHCTVPFPLQRMGGIMRIPSPAPRPWYKELTGYHWFVLLVASLGWMFDTMNQQILTLTRRSAITDLLTHTLGLKPAPGMIAEYGGYATSIFMIGWAIGGVIFGILGDRLGRVKTMIITILGYSLFTGLNSFSTTVWIFSGCCFLTGLAVGGQFAVGVSLVAEVMPDRARPYALGLLQAFSAVGNMTAAASYIGLGQLEMSGYITGAWRYMFLIGSLPALLAVLVVRRLKEPEQWLASKAAKKQMGSFRELLGDPRWRRNSLVGMALAASGVIGLWGIGFFSYDLLGSVLDKTFHAQGLAPGVIAGKKTFWIGITSLVQNFGMFWGVYAFTILTQRVGRKPAFLISFIAAMAMTSFTFWKLQTFSDIFWMIPLMGFTQLALFGGYSIYLPELFPTRLRSTGTSFCYNVGRIAAAAGPTALGLLTSRVYAGYSEPMRYAGITMCAAFLLGIAVLPFAPETQGKPLPE
jgi:MFS family permease